VCFKSYSEFKRAVDACDKFKITETQNESSQKSNKFPTSAQEEVQTEFVFVKIPKLWQMFGKIVLGVKVPKLWQFFGKIGLGKLRARARYIQEKTPYRATVDPMVNSKERQTRAVNSK